MNRRSLLKGIAMSLVSSVAWRNLPIVAKAKSLLGRRVRPSDPHWPSASSWEKLSQAVEGNLLRPQALLAPCAAEPNGVACADVTKNLRNPFYLGDQVAGTQVSGWLDAWTPAPSAYAVAARNAGHVAAAVNFAREHNLRLVVKGAGHSYLGTSNAPDSLLVWTRAMNKVTLHDAFVGQNCEGKITPVPAVTAESGAVWIDLYNVVTTQGGRYVQGGGCTDVGVAGLIQSGGFGSFSKGFGSAAASLLEAEVVTADGAVRVVNACRHPDLFWAIKGGGGGSWGVVTRVTVRTHELPEFFGAAFGRIQAKSAEGFRRLIARFIDFYAANLLNPHWGEQISLEPNNSLKISMVFQGLTGPQAREIWKPFFDWANSSPQEVTVVDKLGAAAGQARRWWNVEGNNSFVPDNREGAPKHHGWWTGDQAQVGAFLHGYDSLWLPASLLQESQRARLGDALFAASRHKKVDLHFNKGLAGAPAEALAASRNTATNPQVLDAFALVIIADGERPSYPGLARPAMNVEAAEKNKRDIDLAAAELRRIVPNAGSYVSESNFFNRSWQADYWGVNYARLRGIKRKYDPEGLFFVHHGVGSEEWSADGFTRLTKH
ncbi:MAG TPA: FAD-binding oxidoreductase [Pyrinomonadaceae bacterium]|jgi:FAD/FMN-containing dehydrogenase|nr:FAD-binding oxidoreductase [Pyrinomonadaceae bacterium]